MNDLVKGKVSQHLMLWSGLQEMGNKEESDLAFNKESLSDLPSGENSHSVAKATWTNQAPLALAALGGACINTC